MLKLPCAPATLVCAMNAASPVSGSATLSVPAATSVVSSMVAPLIVPLICAGSATGVTLIVIAFGVASNAPALSCTEKLKLA